MRKEPRQKLYILVIIVRMVQYIIDDISPKWSRRNVSQVICTEWFRQLCKVCSFGFQDGFIGRAEWIKKIPINEMVGKIAELNLIFYYNTAKSKNCIIARDVYNGFIYQICQRSRLSIESRQICLAKLVPIKYA